MTYGCQQYDPQRLCRYDRRAIDRRCDGCQRTTDRAYLESMSLWIHGVSHIDKACSANGEVKRETCNYPSCNCPFDAPADPNWCARGLPHKG